MNEQEKAVFTSLAQSGEGEVIRTYLLKLMDEQVKKLIDDPSCTTELLAGVRYSRSVIQDLADRFIGRATINKDTERFD